MTGVAPRYVPLLKGKQGEVDALADTSIGTQTNIVPLIEIVPGSGPGDEPAEVLADCRKLVDRLKKKWAGQVMLDGGLLDQDLPLGSDGRGVVFLLAELARLAGLTAQPVLRLGDPHLASTDAAAVCAMDRNGLTIRLTNEELDEEPEVLDIALESAVAKVRLTYGEVDLIIDLGEVQGDLAVVASARIVLPLLRALTSIDHWRSVTVAAGAFPVDLSTFTAWVVGERARDDAKLFDRVTSLWTGRQLDYGDYAVAHPVLGQGAPFAPPPQLRYTASSSWVVLKGRRTDPRANAQFYDICDVVAVHPEFAGVNLGASDARIANSRADGPGNGTTWRRIGTAHHLDYVALRLTTLGEP